MAPVRLPTAGRLLLALALLAAGCSGITVRKAAKSPDLLGAWKASALTGDDLSPRTLQTPAPPRPGRRSTTKSPPTPPPSSTTSPSRTRSPNSSSPSPS